MSERKNVVDEAESAYNLTRSAAELFQEIAAMRWACSAILALTIAGCSDSLAPAPRAAPAAGKTPLAMAPAPSQSAESDPDVLATIEETPGELDSVLASAHPDRAEAMLSAAKKALEATKASYELGETTLANLHVWSRHVLLAERALAQTKEDELTGHPFNLHQPPWR